MILVMEQLQDQVVLDEATTPDGVLELMAYRSRGTVWIGIRSKGSSMEAAFGLHTGSGDHYVEATASIHRTWRVAFGAISPEIERVELRNERGEPFPARIIPLPASFEEEYRAAGGSPPSASGTAS